MKFIQFLRIGVLLIIFTIPTKLLGQYYLWGDDPFSIKWYIIKGDTYKLIYPKGDDSLAMRYLWLLEENKKAVMLGLDGIKPAKIPVLLHTNSAMNNGVVVWAPKRMELYTIPPNSIYSQNWAEQLTIHESRHVGQMTFFTKGVFKILSFFIGEHAAGIGAALYPASWMLEGDAVVAETELTNSGRGRSASFMEYYRASFLQNQFRDWDKWKYGSKKYYTPNVYAMGYLINSTIRYKTNKFQYQGKIFQNYIDKFYKVNVNSYAYKKEVGKTYVKYLKVGQKLMDSIWREDYKHRGVFTQGEKTLDVDSKYYTEYKYPIPIGKDSIFYIKSSFEEPTKLVLVANGREYNKRVFSSSAKNFTNFGDKIYFIENIQNKRWSNEIFNQLYSYDWKKNKIERLSKGTFYNSPSVNNGEISIVEYLKQGGSNLIIKDLKTNEIKAVYKAPDNGQITTTAFLGEYIYAIVITHNGLGLFRKLGNSEWEKVINEQNANIYDLKSSDNFVYFIADIDGVNNVYKIDGVTHNLTRLTNSKYGVSSVNILNNRMYYSELNLGGRYPMAINLENLKSFDTKYDIKLNKGNFSNTYKYIIADELTNQAKAALKKHNLLKLSESKDTNNPYPSIVKYSKSFEEFSKNLAPKKYNKLSHLFRFHSWLPFYVNIDNVINESASDIYKASLGATVLSQNTLGTAVAMFGYSYRKGYNAGHLSFKYTGLYPVFKIQAHINDGPRISSKIIKDKDKDKNVLLLKKLKGPLIETNLVSYVPINLSSHGWRRSFIPQIKWTFKNNEYFNNNINKFITTQTINTYLQYLQLCSVQDANIFPQWGFGIILKNSFTPIKGSTLANVSAVSAYGYFPGFEKKQGLKLSVSYQKRYADYVGNMISGPRGFDVDIYGNEIVMGSVDYAIPVYLGDVSLREFLYIQRLKIMPFVDYGICKGKQKGLKLNENFYSVGTTAMVDCFVLGYTAPLSIGLRYSYLGGNYLSKFDKNLKHKVEFVVGVSLFLKIN